MALTFDDGPDRYTNDLLDLLKKYNASATFMITGNNNAKGEIDNAAFPWANVIKYNPCPPVYSHDTHTAYQAHVQRRTSDCQSYVVPR